MYRVQSFNHTPLWRVMRNEWLEEMSKKPSFKAISIAHNDEITQILYEISEEDE